MISVRAAQRLVVESVSPLPPVRVRLRDALHRVVATDIKAPFDLPRFANSAMDGFAVHSRATRAAAAASPVPLTLEPGIVVAGSRRSGALPPGRAIRIMTGAPIPRGANAVLPQEEAVLRDGALLVRRPLRAGSHVRRAGEDCRRGRPLVRSGMRLHPGLVALLSAFGRVTVNVHRAPRVAVLVTGDEVCSPGRGRLSESGVYDSHAAFLTSALREFDVAPVLVATVRDNEVAVRERIRRALQRSDVVLVTGGVSVGTRDLVRPALEALGVETLFWRVAQKPGKPLYFGRSGKTFVFGLPGNPASMITCYLEYVRPVLRRMLGMSPCYPEELVARLARPIAPKRDRTQFVRGRLSQGPAGCIVTVARGEASHRLTPFRGCDCLVVIPPARRNRSGDGTRVVVHPFPWSMR